MDNLTQQTNHARQLGFNMPDQYSSTVNQSHQEGRNMSIFSDECVSSQSGTCASEKQNEDHVKLDLLLGNSNVIFSQLKLDYNHFTMVGATSSSGVPQTPSPVEDPIYVNPKQYHRILERRRARAKLEARNIITKERRPYLHESRHVHALKRARGSHGRFLNMKQVQQQSQDVSSSSLQHTTSPPVTPTYSEITSVYTSSGTFQHNYHSSFSSVIQSLTGGNTGGGAS